MDPTAPINARQMEVLQWIAGGCPEGVMKGSTYKTTAIALQGRRLVTVSRKGGVWRAATTQAGDHYLRHGTYPDDMRASRQRMEPAVPTAAKAPRAAARQAALSRKPAATRAGRQISGQTIEEQAEDLVARVIQAGGVLQIDTEKDEADYERLCKAAKAAPNLPFANSCVPGMRERGGRTCARSTSAKISPSERHSGPSQFPGTLRPITRQWPLTAAIPAIKRYRRTHWAGPAGFCRP
jgi:hypothetical protein